MKKTVLLFFILINLIAFSQDDARGSVGNSVSTTNTSVKRALIIGISSYNADELKLNYAESDAALFRDYLLKAEQLPEENISYLVNEDAIALNIGRELRRLVSTTNSGETVYIYFAGHGDVVDDFGEKEGYLLAADANANQEYYAGGVIPLEVLNNKVVNNLTNKGAKVILVLDACRSGFIFQEGTQKNMGTIQAMFENSTKILSCGPNELSFESADLGHGYFTYFLVKGLVGNADGNADDSLQYRELDDYLYDNVYTTVSKKHKQNQTPVLRTQNDRLELKAINPNDKAIAFEVLRSEIKSGEKLVARGITPKLANSEVLAIIKQFNQAIEKQDYYGKPKSALEVYKSVINKADFSEGLAFKMQSELIKELSTSAQLLINKYIEGSKALPLSREFYKQAKHLEICLELMDEDDFLRDRIETSKLLLEAYAIVRNKNYSSYNVAKSKLVKALNIQPRAAYIHNALGLVYNYQEVYDSAYYHFKEAKQLINSWSSPVNNIGENLLDQYKYDEAKTELESSLGLKGSNEDAHIKLGIISENQGNYQQAETFYKQALEANPKNATALSKMSNLLKIKGNLKASREWYDRALEVDSLNTIIEYGLFNYITDQRIDDKSAEQLFLKAIDYKPHYSTVYAQYADFLRINKTKRARLMLSETMYNKAIEKDPYDVWAYAGRGWLYMDLNNPRKARESFKKGVDANPNKPKSYYYFGNFFDGIKDFKSAEAYYLKAIEKDKYYMPAYPRLIELYNNQKKQSASIELLNGLIDKNPDAPDLHNLLGDTYFSKGEYSKAINAFNKAIELDNTYSKGFSNLGYSELQVNNYEAAKKHYQMANTFAPYKNPKSDIAETILTMAKNKEKFGTPEETKSLYKLAYEIDDSVISGLPYAEYLYLNGEPELAFEKAELLIKKEAPRKLYIQNLKLLVKAAIDNVDNVNADLYFNQLLKKATVPDLLIGAVYYRFKGDYQQGNALIKKTNPQLIRSNKLKSIYSEATINRYILNR